MSLSEWLRNKRLQQNMKRQGRYPIAGTSGTCGSSSSTVTPLSRAGQILKNSNLVRNLKYGHQSESRKFKSSSKEACIEQNDPDNNNQERSWSEVVNAAGGIFVSGSLGHQSEEDNFDEVDNIAANENKAGTEQEPEIYRPASSSPPSLRKGKTQLSLRLGFIIITTTLWRLFLIICVIRE